MRLLAPLAGILICVCALPPADAQTRQVDCSKGICRSVPLEPDQVRQLSTEQEIQRDHPRLYQAIANLDNAKRNRDYAGRAASARRALAEGERIRIWSPSLTAIFGSQAGFRQTMNFEIALGLDAGGFQGDPALLEAAIEAYVAGIAAAPVSPRLGSSVYCNLGAAYSSRRNGEHADNLEKSINAYERCVALRKQLNDPVRAARAQIDLATAYGNRVLGEPADNNARSILEITDSISVLDRLAPLGAGPARVNLAGFWMSSFAGDREANIRKSIEILNQVISQPPADQLASMAHNGLANAYFQLGDMENSATHTKASIAAAIRNAALPMTPEQRAANQRHIEYQQLNYAAMRLLSNGDVKALAQEALPTLQAGVRSPGLRSDRRAYLAAQKRLGEALLILGDLQSARAALLQAAELDIDLTGGVSATGDARILDPNQSELYPLLALTLNAQGAPQQAVQYLDQGRARRLTRLLAIDDLRLSNSEKARLRALAVEIEDIEAAPDASAADRLTRLRRDQRALTEKGARLQATRNVVAPEIGVALLPVVTNAGAALFTVSASGATTGASLTAPRTLMRDAANAWSAAYQQNNIDGAIDAMRRTLGPSFSDALKTALPEPGSRITLLPQASIAIMPLGLLRSSRTGRLLIEDYDIAYSTSLRALAAPSRQAAPASRRLAPIIATRDAGPPAAPLEIEMMRGFVPAMTPTSVGRSKADTVAQLRQAEYWHFAVHARFDPVSPRRSGLVLAANEMLTVGDLYSLLGGTAPRLVVLSACETGIVDTRFGSQEFEGLPMAFIQAGAQGVIGSLWPVPDGATALLMTRFYELHFTQNLDPPAALRQAQLWLRDATAGELTAYVSARQAVNLGLSLASLQEEIWNRVGERPYANPRFWGSWVYYGR